MENCRLELIDSLAEMALDENINKHLTGYLENKKCRKAQRAILNLAMQNGKLQIKYDGNLRKLLIR